LDVLSERPANAWQRPLDRATFRVRTPPSFVLTTASYPFTAKEATARTHEVVLAPFQPTREVVVGWASEK